MTPATQSLTPFIVRVTVPQGAVKGESIEQLYFKLHPFSLLGSLGVEVDEMKLNAPVKDDSKTRHRHKSEEEYPRSKQDIFNDALLSFDFNIRHGLYYDEGVPLTNETKTVLHNWLDLLKKSMPPGWKIHKTIDTLLGNFDVISSGEESLLQIMDSIPPPDTKKWSASCVKGEKGMGYTCGLWELFHIMTIGVVEWNMMLNEEQAAMIISTIHAAETLRDFIHHFFACEECRTHFTSEYAACSYNRCNRLTDEDPCLANWIQLPLWLSETHNGVNVRLAKEKAQRESVEFTHAMERRKLWPLHEDCSKCHEEEGTHEADTYKFLRIEYWYVCSVFYASVHAGDLARLPNFFSFIVHNSPLSTIGQKILSLNNLEKNYGKMKMKRTTTNMGRAITSC